MSGSGSLSDRLARAISLREQGKDQEARDLLLELHGGHPDDANVNLQCAWIHDRLGLERDAVRYYERALELGLDGEDQKNAMLGLGSTYRALGEYEKAANTLTWAVEMFPEDRPLQVFQAMALYNDDKAKDACELLLSLLIETTADESIIGYRDAIRTYAGDLNRVWA